MLTTINAFGDELATNDSLNGTTQYTYDSRENLIKVVDANGHEHRFEYSRTNHVLTSWTPLSESTTYRYDENGNLINRVSPSGFRRMYVYNDVGRRTKEEFYVGNASAPAQTVEYIYDGRNLLSGYTQGGDTESSASYAYDAKGQKIGETVIYGSGTTAVTKTLQYGYEANGLKNGLTYADGTIQTTTYDKNRLASITIKDDTLLYQDYQWRVPTQVTMPGAARTLTYDSLQRPTAITSMSAAGATIMDYNYQYDAAGNITRRTTEDGDYLYSYDSLDRLTGATPPENMRQSPANPGGLPIEQYTYDGVHNRKTSAQQPGPWVYNEDNELQGYGVGADEETYSYDDNGNTRLQKTGNPLSPSRIREFIYDAAERMSEIKDNGATIAKYQYDPMGRRFKKEVNGTVIWFQYADEGMIAEFTQNGTLRRAYGWMLGNLWGTDPVWLANISGAAWTLNFYHNDHLGTSQRLTNAAGSVTWKAFSESFGKTTVDTASQITNPFRFPGQYADSETGLNYNQFRDYQPLEGRYIESDPSGISSGINAYSYVTNSPQSFVDPTGLVRIECPTCKSKKADELKKIIDHQCEVFSENRGPVTDVKLRNCIRKTCSTNIVVKCVNCKRKTCPDGNGGWYTRGVPNGSDDGRDTVVCLNTELEGNGREWEGAAAVHEIAHRCKWEHGDGKGIPGDPGKPRPGVPPTSGCHDAE